MIGNNCLNCNKYFLSYPSLKQKYCSHDCYVVQKKRKPIILCPQCGNNFVRRRKETVFCSQKCRAEKFEKDHYKKTTCKICNKSFSQKTYRVNTTCSKECNILSKRKENSPTWKGGIKEERDRRKSLEMVMWRKKVFERDKYTCQICKKKGDYLEPHHILFYSNFPKLRSILENGITLCKSCHIDVHKSIKRTYFLKINKRQLETVVQHSKYRDWLFEVLSHIHKK